MTRITKPTPIWLRILFLLTGQPEKIILDYDAGENNHEFSKKTQEDHR